MHHYDGDHHLRRGNRHHFDASPLRRLFDMCPSRLPRNRKIWPRSCRSYIHFFTHILPFLHHHTCHYNSSLSPHTNNFDPHHPPTSFFIYIHINVKQSVQRREPSDTSVICVRLSVRTINRRISSIHFAFYVDPSKTFPYRWIPIFIRSVTFDYFA